MDQLNTYINKKRAEGLGDADIRTNLVTAGWKPEVVDAGLNAGDVPAPPLDQAASSPHPVAVVQAFSTRGLEYIIMFISLWVSATAVGYLLHQAIYSLFGSSDDFSDLNSVAIAALIVSLPIFSLLFLRLKKHELVDPSVKSDPSRKKAVQLTLIVTFLIGLGHIIAYVYRLVAFGSDMVEAPGTNVVAEDLLHLAVTLLIAGGIFAYYWLDEHKREKPL